MSDEEKWIINRINGSRDTAHKIKMWIGDGEMAMAKCGTLIRQWDTKPTRYEEVSNTVETCKSCHDEKENIMTRKVDYDVEFHQPIALSHKDTFHEVRYGLTNRPGAKTVCGKVIIDTKGPDGEDYKMCKNCIRLLRHQRDNN